MRRRRRPQLQVSTFPFLAVLLCTMGVLILLLLVLDFQARRTKRAEAAQVRRLAQREAAERCAAELAQVQEQMEIRRREREAARQAAEAQRIVRVDEVRSEIQRVQNHQARTLEQQRSEQQRLAALRRMLEDDEAKAKQLQGKGNELQSRSAAQSVHADRVQKERRALIEQLSELERIAKIVHQEVQQRPPVYSLVPYKGRQGTRRTPIVLECVQQMVRFQPNGKSYRPNEIADPTALRAEIENECRSASGKDAPYVLLLIRPSGIAMYYAVQRALQGSAVDVGYEFIEEEVALDFSSVRPNESVAVPSISSSPNVALNAPRSVAPPREDSWPAGSNRPSVSSPSPLGTASPGILQAPGPGERLPQSLEMPFARGASGASPAMPHHSVPASGNAKPAGPSRSDTFIPPSPYLRNEASSSAAHKRRRETEAAPTPPEPPRADWQPATSPGAARPYVPTATGDQVAADESSAPRALRGPEERLLSPDKSKQPKPVPSRPATLAVGRELEVTIECKADGITVLQTNERYDLAALSNVDNPFRNSIETLIRRRRERTPELRVQLRFLIHADGLRSYYAAAALLESLKLPTTTERLKPQKP